MESRPLNRVNHSLGLCDSEARHFPPTDLYNEGWMLRLVLDWFAHNRNLEHELGCPEGSDWYSEALLPSQFLARSRGDKLAESWTHADGVIGQFLIGEIGVGGLSLPQSAHHFVVTEAKMFSKLSAGVTNARYYNQAARNVACIAEVLRLAEAQPASFSNLGFYVLAPRSRIDEGVFSKYMDKQSVHDIVKRRVSEYNDSKKVDWFQNAFRPLLERITIREISWEEVLAFISDSDPEYAVEMQNFYAKCLKYNQYESNRFMWTKNDIEIILKGQQSFFLLLTDMGSLGRCLPNPF